MNVIETSGYNTHIPMYAGTLKVLMLEDEPTDADLILRTLRDGGLTVTAQRVTSKAAFAAALDDFAPDIVLADFKLPSYDGLSAIKLMRTKHPELPVIVVTGALGDEAAVELIKAGAVDYVLKDRMARLPAAVEKTIFKAAESAQLRKQEAAVHAAEKNLYAIATYAQDAIIMMNEKMIVTFWNKSAEKCFGYLAAEAVGRDFFHLVATADDEQSIRRAINERMNANNDQLAGWTHKFKARKKDGASAAVDLSISLVRMEGKWNTIGVVRPQSIQF